MEAALQEAVRQDVPPEAQLQAFSLLIKIVSNVLEPPTRNAEDASKYRCLNSNSNLLQQRLLKHGPAYEALLFALGFVRTSEPPTRAAAPQQQAEQQQQEAEATQRQTSKEDEPLRQSTEQREQQPQQAEQQQPEGGPSYYYYLPESVELSGLVEALQLLRATTESLKLNGSSNEQQCAAEGEAAAASAVGGGADASAGSGARPFPGTSASLHAADGVKLPLTTSRAIRGQATSTHAKNQAALRQLREEQRERFEHRAETTRSTRSTAAAAAPAAASRRASGSRGGTDATSAEKKWSSKAAPDAVADATEAAYATPQAGAGSGSGKKKLQKGFPSLQAAGRFFRKFCKGKGGGSFGKQRGGSAAT